MTSSNFTDVPEDFEPDEQEEEDVKDILKACIKEHGGILHPKWVLGETEPENVIAELKEYVGLEDIELLQPKPIPTTPRAKGRMADSIGSASKVSNIALKTGYTYTSKSGKDSWNIETRERTKEYFIKATDLQRELMQEADNLRQVLAEVEEERELLRADNRRLRKANRELEVSLQSRISMMKQQQEEVNRIAHHNSDLVSALSDISKSLQHLNLSK